MDTELATKIAQNSSTLVIQDVPPGTEFGIDMNIYYIGDKFKGVKMIPKGFHFAYLGAVNSSGQSAPRTGFFFYNSSKNFIVKKWDAQLEALSTNEIPSKEIDRFKSNLFGSLDRFLGPYEFNTWKLWLSLTSYITEPLLAQLDPLNGVVNSVTQLTSPKKNSVHSSTPVKKVTEDTLLPDMKPVPGTVIRFTPIPSKRYPEGSTPQEISQHSLDSTYSLEVLLQSYLTPEGVLGELQLAFVSFLIGQVYEGFEQWKALISLLCQCDKGLSMYGDLFINFITILSTQIKEIPKDYLTDIVSKSNFLTASFQNFFLNVGETDHAKLRKWAEQFKKSLIAKHGWCFDDEEPDDCQPVVIESC